MARFFFVSPVAIDPWYWLDAEAGVGGNEQGVTEFAHRLVRDGHEVTVYTQTPWSDGPREWRGTKWDYVDNADWSQPGIWVLFRCPQLAANLRTDPDVQPAWLVVQDFEYEWEAPYFDRIDRVLMTCRTHRDIIAARYPSLEPRLFVTSNGVKVDLIEELEASETFQRNPYKIMFASSPDRGLRTLLHILSRAREVVPSLELHVFYGFNGIDRIAAQQKGGWPAMEQEKALILDLASRTKNVFMRGRVTQRELYREWLTSGIFVACTIFREMSYISGREAQCCGAVPIVTPVWGAGDHVKHGVFVFGDPEEPMIRARFAGELIRMAYDLPRQEAIRREMMVESRKECDWNRFVNQWSAMAEEHVLCTV